MTCCRHICFVFYVRDVIQQVTQMKMGCNIGGEIINLLCFADDMALLAPVWSARRSVYFR